MNIIPKKNPKLLFRFTEKGSVVIMSGQGEDFFWEIKGQAALLWRTIDGKTSWSEIKRRQAPKSKLAKDKFNLRADQFLKQLLAAKLIDARPVKK